METASVTMLSLFFSLALVSASSDGLLQYTETSNITLRVPETRQMHFNLYHNYSISVNTSDSGYSAFSIQVHTQLYPVTLTNDSLYCRSNGDSECTTRGSNVGLVQLRNENVTLFLFRVRVECGPGECSVNSLVDVLLAVVDLWGDVPVPGGCALTSNLLIDPNLSINFTSYSTVVRFQDSDTSTYSYPVCDEPINGTYPLQDMKYTLYTMCLGSRQFSVEVMMAAIEDMLTVEDCEKQDDSHSDLDYRDIKKVTFASIPGQGVIYNVIATNKNNGAKSAYTPSITYACDLHSTDHQTCRGDLSPLNGFLGVLLLLVGLFLCGIGHIFFHGEVLVLHWVGGSFLGYMILSITSSMDTNVLVGVSLVFGLGYSGVWFLFWFMTAWYWFHVIAFGLYADFFIISAILYSPLEDVSVFTALQISYVYYLTIVCGMILFMVPIVAFPRALSIWSSSLVGSYTFIFGIGMFTYTELSEIVLLVVKKFSISGFYTAHIDCPPMTIDYIMIGVFLMLLVVGVIIQTTVVQIRKTKHNHRQRTAANRRQRTKFNSFPSPSLYRQLMKCGEKRCYEGEPLLTPTRLSSSEEQSQWLPGNSGQYSKYGATSDSGTR